MHRMLASICAVAAALTTLQSAHATFIYPEVENVPTERLIENLESRLRSPAVEGEEIRAGEELELRVSRGSQDLSVFFSVESAKVEPIPEVSGTFEVDADGFIELPGRTRVEVAGLTLEAVGPAVKAALGEVAETWFVRVVQSRQQRAPRRLPGETFRMHRALARVHSISAFQILGEFQVSRSDGLPFFGFGDEGRSSVPPAYRLDAARLPEPTRAERQHHLERAVQHYERALELALQRPRESWQVMSAQLGLAWCRDQLGERSRAIAEYREAFDYALDYTEQYGSFVSAGVIAEIAGYLTDVLDPVADGAEVRRLQEYLKQAEAAPRHITPIVIPLSSDDALEALVSAQAEVSFDLDGSGLERRWGWITPKASWLVHDPQRTGHIASGLQLVGNVTFWMFWSDGYEALDALDDDGDGELSADELDGLALWHDANVDGISDPGEVTPISDTDIVSLSTHASEHPSGIPYSPRGVTLSNGTVRPSYDWIVHSTGEAPKPLH